jgi:hypothetical protein
MQADRLKSKSKISYDSVVHEDPYKEFRKFAIGEAMMSSKMSLYGDYDSKQQFMSTSPHQGAVRTQSMKNLVKAGNN